jgi:hypothetical protein
MNDSKSQIAKDTDPCGFGGPGWMMEVDVMTGNRNDTPTFDTNNDMQISTADLNLNGIHDNASGRAVSSIPAAPGIMRMPTPANGKPFENKYVNTYRRVRSPSSVDADSVGRKAGDVRRAGDMERCRSGVDNSGDRQCRSVGSYNGRTNV